MTTSEQPETEAPLAENLEAERAVLGAMLWSREAVNVARLELRVDHFYRDWHGELFARICDLEDRGVRCDAQAVVTTLVDGLIGEKELGTDGRRTNYIFDLWQDCITPGNVAFHTREVRAAARRRALQAEHKRLGQALNSSDNDALLDVVAQQSIALQLLAEEPEAEAPVEGLATWESFVKTQGGQERWVVPQLIGRHDMILILAAPGAGKSFLSRQMCLALASGVHPFTLQRITPVRTLLVDLENAPGQVADETIPLLGQVKRLGDFVEDRGWVWMRPEGLNLRERADAVLLERVIAEVRPDLVAFGSLYNAYKRGADGWDVAAEEVQDVLKKLRARYDLAFWVEHHMVRAQGGVGHTGTPFGGTSWEKWPTHGRVLRKASDKLPIYLLEEGTFRGDRGRREFPIALKRGGQLPFTAYFDEAELELELGALEEGRAS